MNKVKILVILTGGTICSFGDSENLNRALDMGKAKRILIENFRNSTSHYRNEEFEVVQFLDVLSENMTIDKWNMLTNGLRTIDFSMYKGVIVAHGTDTLAYTSSLLALILSSVRIPVIMVSSNRPLNSEGANGNDNFSCAVQLICEGLVKGVYVVYRNMNGCMYIHKGGHLNQCGDYSEDFYSHDGIMVYGDNEKGNNTFTIISINEWADKHWNEGQGICLTDVGELKNDVLYIRPYVGLRYDTMDIDNSVRAVVHQLYHSQTACSDTGEDNSINSICSFAYRCKEKNIPVFATPCYEQHSLYTSSETMKESGVIPVYGMTNEMAYVKALVAGALRINDAGDMCRFMGRDICGEFMDV